MGVVDGASDDDGVVVGDVNTFVVVVDDDGVDGDGVGDAWKFYLG